MNKNRSIVTYLPTGEIYGSFKSACDSLKLSYSKEYSLFKQNKNKNFTWEKL